MDAVPRIRQCRPYEIDDLYEICLRTGAAGRDATGLMTDHRLLGDLYAAPYAVLEAQHAFVVDDGTGTAVGYVLGVVDTAAFEALCEAVWWPSARLRHPDPPPEGSTELDALFTAVLHHRHLPPPELLAEFPSHLHIDLLPSHQGQGWGRQLMDTILHALRNAGSPGVHWGVATANRDGRAFYRHLGFTEAAGDDVTCTFTTRL